MKVLNGLVLSALLFSSAHTALAQGTGAGPGGYKYPYIPVVDEINTCMAWLPQQRCVSTYLVKIPNQQKKILRRMPSSVRTLDWVGQSLSRHVTPFVTLSSLGTEAHSHLLHYFTLILFGWL